MTDFRFFFQYNKHDSLFLQQPALTPALKFKLIWQREKSHKRLISFLCETDGVLVFRKAKDSLEAFNGPLPAFQSKMALYKATLNMIS